MPGSLCRRLEIWCYWGQIRIAFAWAFEDKIRTLKTRHKISTTGQLRTERYEKYSPGLDASTDNLLKEIVSTLIRAKRNNELRQEDLDFIKEKAPKVVEAVKFWVYNTIQ